MFHDLSPVGGRVRRALAFAVLACAAGSTQAQEISEYREPAYPQGPDAVPLLHEVWAFSADNIYPPELAERFDLAALEQLEDSLHSANSIALADVLNPFLDSLGVSHTRFYDRRHQGYYMLRSLFSTRDLDAPQLYTVGVQLDDIDLGAIRSVMEGSPAAAAGIRRGEHIVAVDGYPFESLLQWQRPSSTRLTIRGEGGYRDVTLTPIRQGFHRALARATAASGRVFDCRHDRRIGYLHLWSGTHSEFLDILRDAVGNAREAGFAGFVLDLRDGYGGAWWPYLDPFFANREEYFASANYDSRGQSDPVRAEPQSNAGAWLGPLVVIINSGTRSGKESLAFQFKKSGRAKLFGTSTSGAFTGGLGAFADRSGGYIFYLSVQEILLDGTVMEGVGVSPDIVVPDESDGDAPLSAALDYLACQIEPELQSR